MGVGAIDQYDCNSVLHENAIMDRSRQWRSSIVVAAISDRSGTRDVLKKPFNLSGFQIFLFKFCQFIIFVTYVHSDDVVSFVAAIPFATMCDQGSQSLVAITDSPLFRVSTVVVAIRHRSRMQ